MTKVRKISRKELKQGLLGVAIFMPCLMFHCYLWWLWGITFMPKILPLGIILVSSWISAWLLRKPLSRLLYSNNILLHMVIAGFVLSWIPFGILMEANYRLADKSIHVVTLPVVDRGIESTRRGGSTTNWVKVKPGWYRKFLYVHDKSIALDRIDSVRFRLLKGYFGFDVMVDRGRGEFICH